MSAAIDVSEADFKEQVLDRSYEVPVVVDFWAAWCAPCRTLGPVLERLAEEAKGAWVLAKVDVDANQALAAAAQVQGIPAVRAFKDGRQVAEFTGALPEPQVRQWLAALGPTRADLAYQEGAAAEERGDLEGALEAYRRSLQADPGHPGARGAAARLELVLRSSRADEDALRRRLEADPGDVTAILGLADLEAARGDLAAAAGRLVGAVETASGSEREDLKRHLLELLDTVPPENPAAMSARRALARVLF